MNDIGLIIRTIIRREDKILLCQSKRQGHYFLPGGHVEFDDTLIGTIYKELNEELALEENQISNIKFLDHVENIYKKDDEQFHEINVVYTIDIDDKAETKSMEDHISFEWITLKHIKDINFLPLKLIPIIEELEQD